MHLSFDFSYAVFIFNLSELNSQLSRLYTLLFMLMLVLYFAFEMKQISEIWRASVGDVNDIAPGQLRQLFLDFFLEITMALFVMSAAASLVTKLPIPCLLILYSFLIPQIVHSVRSTVKKSKDFIFVSLISLTRLFPVYYFTWYPLNILGIHEPAIAIGVTIYVGLQFLIVMLQNCFGGAFFLARSMRPVPFDYRSVTPDPGSECAICLTAIEATDDAMVTPCQHPFHSECLRRWMDEQLVCPICRHPLPGIDFVN
jgi:hypothetical protein